MMQVPTSTLRYYEQEGLMPEVTRTESGMRRYGGEALRKLRLIECLKAAGLSIREIAEYFSLSQKGGETVKKRREIFFRRREIMKEQMRAIQETLDFLDYKCWYYETAEKLGAEQAVKDMAVSEVPEKYRKTLAALRDGFPCRRPNSGVPAAEHQKHP